MGECLNVPMRLRGDRAPYQRMDPHGDPGMSADECARHILKKVCKGKNEISMGAFTPTIAIEPNG